MIQCSVKYHELRFKQAAGTSRGVLRTKPSWFFILKDTEKPEKVGVGECSIIPGLSYESNRPLTYQLNQVPDYIKGLKSLDKNSLSHWSRWPAIRFGLETAIMDLHSYPNGILFPGPFTQGTASIPINGLIWMGDKEKMFNQLKAKIDSGWKCIKIKIGAIDFADELQLIKYIRKHFGPEDITIRVDANGAFSSETAMERLEALASLSLHSIEQPIAAGQWEQMANLCARTPLPIALDEELIGVFDKEEKKQLLEKLNPQYIVLKPSLLGGFSSSEEWIHLAKEKQIGFWITSALESNIGLNAIAQWTAHLNISSYQGLGTGMLYDNNIPSPLEMTPGALHYRPGTDWDYSALMADNE